MTDDGDISFGRCSCGCGFERPSRERHPWAMLAGYADCVRWLGQDGTGSRSSPTVGGKGSLHLRRPFLGQVGIPFWMLYETDRGWNNGYVGSAMDAAELAGLRMVRCRIVRPPVDDTGPGVMLADAEVLDVLAPDDIMGLPPSRDSLGSAATGLRYDPATAWHGTLRYIVSNFEGDIVTWALLHHGAAEIHLLAYGESGFHEDFVYAGKRPLTRSEAAAFPSC